MTPDSLPILSIITPVFNGERYIRQAIENFLAQECAVAELLIMDGNSQDRTVSIIQEYASHSHIRWVSEKDRGQSDAMNKGIRLAKGKYISFLNVDDFYETGALQEVCQWLTRPDAPAFIAGNCKVWDEAGNLIFINRPAKLRPWHLLSGLTVPVNPTAYFYLKALHEQAGYYNEANHYNMDIEFLVRASLVCKMEYVNRDWGNFRLLPEAKTGSDIQKGLIEKRKRELYATLGREVPFVIRLQAKLIRVKYTIENFWRQRKRRYKRLVEMISTKAKLLLKEWLN